MRLLHTRHISGDESFETTLCEFVGENISAYAILSHRWREEEVSFADMRLPVADDVQAKKCYTKLQSSCRVAFMKGFSYLWTDTYCIDKSSSGM